MKYENEMEIDVGRCIRALGQKYWFILCMAVVGGVIGIALTLSSDSDIYSASSSVYSVASTYKETQTGTSAMNDYMQLATSMKVCERASLLLGSADITGSDVMSSISVALSSTNSSSTYTQTDSAILKITAYWTDPVIAMEMSQAVAEAFIIEINNMLGADVVQLLDKPYTYSVYYNATQNMWKVRILAVLAGAVLAAAVIVLTEIFGTRARTVRECSLREQLPIIGVIPDYKE